jgi:hypothetical protein
MVIELEERFVVVFLVWIVVEYPTELGLDE